MESSRTSAGRWGIDDRGVSEESAAGTVAGSGAHPDGSSTPSDIRNSEGGGSLVEEAVCVCFLCADAGHVMLEGLLITIRKASYLPT